MDRSLLFIVSVTLFCSVLVTAATESSWKAGVKCNEMQCYASNKGYFDQNTRFGVTSFMPYDAIKWLRTPQLTNFVLYIRNIERTLPQGLQVCNLQACWNVESTEDQVLIIQNTRWVGIWLKDPTVKFELQYYAGCDIIDRTNIKTSAVSTAAYAWADPLRWAHCSVVIPRLYDYSTTQHVAATNLFLYNSTFAQPTNLAVTNLLTGQRLLTVENSTDFDMVSVMANASPVRYQMRNFVSTVLLFTAENCLDSAYAPCSQVRWDLEVQVLSAGDLQCFERKQSCLYGMLKEDQDPCEDYDSEEDKCSAFDEFESKVMGIDDLDDASEFMGRSARRVYKPKRCKKMYNRGGIKESRHLCRVYKRGKKKGELIGCSMFGKCQMYCFIRRTKHRICDKQESVALFQ